MFRREVSRISHGQSNILRLADLFCIHITEPHQRRYRGMSQLWFLGLHHTQSSAASRSRLPRGYRIEKSHADRRGSWMAALWRCDRCKRFVELAHGCNHMMYVSSLLSYLRILNGICSCHCGAEFCYQCARRWKTCPCDQWDEIRLRARQPGRQ